MIQISSGLLKGVQLRSPAGKQTRPSSERLRQGIFNILRNYRWSSSPDDVAAGSVVEGALVIDLFAGTGAWGIEALSNGAAEAWFVESHPLALRTLHENLRIASRCFESQKLETPAIHLLRRDLAAAYRKLPQARVIFCDPPYDKGWPAKVLALETECGRLVTGGLFLYEAREGEELPPETPGLRRFDTKIYGDSAVHFFVKL